MRISFVVTSRPAFALQIAAIQHQHVLHRNQFANILIIFEMVFCISLKLCDFVPVFSFMYKSLRISIITDFTFGSFCQYFIGTIEPEKGRSMATERPAVTKKLTKAVLISVGVWNASVPIQIAALM